MPAIAWTTANWPLPSDPRKPPAGHWQAACPPWPLLCISSHGRIAVLRAPSLKRPAWRVSQWPGWCVTHWEVRIGASITGRNGAMTFLTPPPVEEAGRGLAFLNRTVIDAPVLSVPHKMCRTLRQRPRNLSATSATAERATKVSASPLRHSGPAAPAGAFRGGTAMPAGGVGAPTQRDAPTYCSTQDV